MDYIEPQYRPIKDGVAKTVQSVVYQESKPTKELAHLVHCYWELRTKKALQKDFVLHAVPDACVNILFNQIEPEIAGVTALRTTYEELNLGREFHYVGIQFFPGVWQGDRKEIFDSYVGSAYTGPLPLIQTSRQLMPLDFVEKQPLLTKLVLWFVAEKLIIANEATEKILTNIETLHSVADMAAVTGLSARQLQRTLKRTTNFTPHDLLKVLRMQQTFKQHYLDFYSDQSHYIHSFRKINGYTPEKFTKKFDV